jgi:hypothetical protein
MSIEIRYEVLTPEAGVQRITGAAPPMMGALAPGMKAPAMGPGGAPPRRPAGPPPSFSFAKRLDTLEGKTIYLVDLGFGGSYKFMQQVQKWFAKHMPSVKTIRKRKTGHVFTDDTTDLWDEIKAKGHAAVVGVAG